MYSEEKNRIEIGFKVNGKRNGICKVFERDDSKGEYFLYVNGKKSKEIEHKKEKIDIYEYIKDKDRIYGMVLTYDRKVIEDNIKKKKEQCKEFKFK